MGQIVAGVRHVAEYEHGQLLRIQTQGQQLFRGGSDNLTVGYGLDGDTTVTSA